MVRNDLINESRFDEITELAQQAVHSVLGFTLMHVGINSESTSTAPEIAQLFCKMFGLDYYRPGNSSDYAGSIIEVMKAPGFGKNGHIAIGTNSVDRAMAYLELQGYEFAQETIKRDSMNNAQVVYFVKECGGFAIHLLQKK